MPCFLLAVELNARDDKILTVLWVSTGVTRETFSLQERRYKVDVQRLSGAETEEEHHRPFG